MDYIKTLYDICDMLGDQLTDSVSRLRSAGGKINNQDADYIDKLTHSLKSVKCVISMDEEEDNGSYDDGMSNRGYSRNSYRGSYRGSSYRDGGSYARGRGRNARRDSMGRYSSDDGYSRGDDMVEELRSMMESAPDDKTRQEFQRFISKMEQMQ